MVTGYLPLYFLYSSLFRNNASSFPEKGKAALLKRGLAIREPEQIALLRPSVGTKWGLSAPGGLGRPQQVCAGANESFPSLP